jgi:hypothetical protein
LGSCLKNVIPVNIFSLILTPGPACLYVLIAGPSFSPAQESDGDHTSDQGTKWRNATGSLEEEEEGLHGVFKRLRRNGHQLKKEAANSSTLTVTHRRLNPQNSLCMRGSLEDVSTHSSSSSMMRAATNKPQHVTTLLWRSGDDGRMVAERLQVRF